MKLFTQATYFVLYMSVLSSVLPKRCVCVCVVLLQKTWQRGKTLETPSYLIKDFDSCPL